MRKRAFICGLVNFPRGGASSNYVQYFGLSLYKADYEVTVISNRNPDYKVTDRYGNLAFAEVVIPQNVFLKKILYKFVIGHTFVKKLSHYHLNVNDKVILYTHHSLLAEEVIRYAKKRGAKVGICLVECFSADDFKSGRADKQYIEEQKIYSLAEKKCDFVFPISSYIQNCFDTCREKTFCIPILTDTKEFMFQKRKKSGARRFIYPANGRIKDGLQDMLEAIRDILDSSADKFEFHFCGIKEETVKGILGDKCFDTENKRRIFIHQWMKYEKLIELYQEMDFLIIARRHTQMTEANFPSKVPELLTYGVIPIASDVGDYTKLYLKDPENCVLMKGCSKKIIKEAIYRALQMDENKIMSVSRNARKLAETQFDYTVWSERVQKFLDSV